MPSHEQIKRAREAALPWHQEVVAKHAAKRPKRFPFSPLELTWLVMVSYDDGDACSRKSGRFGNRGSETLEFWKEELVRNETGMDE